MTSDYDKITRTELHKSQEKVNRLNAQLNRQAAFACTQIEDVKDRLLCIIYAILVGASFWVAVGSIFFDHFAQIFNWQFQPGLGWQQLTVGLLSVITCFTCGYMFIKK